MLPWNLKHRIFAYDTYVKNGESRVCGGGGDVCGDFWNHAFMLRNPVHLENWRLQYVKISKN